MIQNRIRDGARGVCGIFTETRMGGWGGGGLNKVVKTSTSPNR